MSKILLLDIETLPNIAYIWKLYEETTSTSMIAQEWHLACWCAKWLDKKEIFSSSLMDFKNYKQNPENDKECLEKLWKLLDESNIIIAHNGSRFDIPKINTRFVKHGMKPPSPYKIVDTLKSARFYFGFTSNRLNDLGQFLEVGKKVDTGGFQLWKRCMQGEKKAFQEMVKYCKQDVLLLERVYKKLRPYITNHPSITVTEDSPVARCPKCGSNKLHRRGITHTNVCTYRRYVCTNCGAWSRGKDNIRNNKLEIR